MGHSIVCLVSSRWSRKKFLQLKLLHLEIFVSDKILLRPVNNSDITIAVVVLTIKDVCENYKNKDVPLILKTTEAFKGIFRGSLG